MLLKTKITYSDIELKKIIDGCVKNDRIAQEKLYNYYSYKMLVLVRSYIKCPYKADEVLNNGFLRAFKKMEMYDFKGSFEGWLRRIIFHSVMDYIKVDKRNNKDVVTDMSLFNTNSLKRSNIDKQFVEGNGCTNMCFDQLVQLVNQLPNATGIVFNLYVFEGYTHSQIGEVMNISVGTSKWHLSEGRSILRNKILRLGLNVEA
jgi:RNA polymerase sigma-70 factor (ECF subfamily)